MAVTRRIFIIVNFIVSVLAASVFIVAIGTDAWVTSEASTSEQSANSDLQYGLFSGTFTYRLLTTPTSHPLYMTCAYDEGVCAVSCKTNEEARKDEVRLLALGQGTSPVCNALTTATGTTVDTDGALILSGVYISTVLFVSLCVISATCCAGFSLYNVTNNPVEPMFGILGLYIYNGVGAFFALVTLMLWGIHYATSMQNTLAFSYIISGELQPVNAMLGFSYWMMFVGMVCHFCNIGMLLLRAYLINRDPPPPVINLDKKADDTVFMF